MSKPNIDHVLNVFPKLQKANVRVKLHEHDQPTDWSKWLIAPVEGYLELENCGPLPVKDVEWLETEFLPTSPTSEPRNSSRSALINRIKMIRIALHSFV